MKHQAIRNLYANVVTIRGDEAFDKDENKITLDATAVDNEVKRLEDEYDNDYARKRKAEYPTIEELVVALYDTEDKAAIDAKRAAVKAKYPKGS
jgi:6-pyruvoyl-tetrahydropterin synthase